MVLLPILFLAAAALADEPVDLDPSAYDEANALRVMQTCAACHGVDGMGSAGGIYPRLAGLHAAYIAAQIEDFKSGARKNPPMLPVATKGGLPPEDVRDVSLYLAGLDGPRGTPTVDGDAALGKLVLKRSCARCHGKRGEGRARVPFLAGQRLGYVRNQIDLIQSGERAHPDVAKHFGTQDAEAWDALIAHLSTLDD